MEVHARCFLAEAAVNLVSPQSLWPIRSRISFKRRIMRVME